ncbi:glycosyltransferase family 4 protein [Hyunsoonleella sp. 2307UL5-6]|uniref:glycosyltransferase family 4 protein n=1 Tax=Hyunsoonleella sp. 2307UL5-6 TaxID=3384768 RepID=UPI0039BC5630
MKIDFIITSLRRGGAERVLVTLANNLVLRGNNVRVLTFKDAIEYELNEKIQHLFLEEKNIKNQTLSYTYALFKFYKNNKHNKPNVAISFMTQTSLSAILVCKLLGIKIIASEHTNHTRTSTNKSLVVFTRKHLYKYANFITVLTKYDFDYYKNYTKNVIVMPNPCSFKLSESKNTSKEKVILAIGGLDKYNIKGFDNLLPIMKPILDKHKDWKIKIVGNSNNDGLTFLNNLVEELGIKNQVIFTGLANNIQSMMKSSEIFVLSSRTEGLPMALIECMSQSMCCVAYDCVSGPSDIITHNVDGLLVENQNKNMMQKHITKVIEDENLRLRLSENANKITSKFDVELICDKWEKLILELQ